MTEQEVKDMLQGLSPEEQETLMRRVEWFHKKITHVPLHQIRAYSAGGIYANVEEYQKAMLLFACGQSYLEGKNEN